MNRRLIGVALAAALAAGALTAAGLWSYQSAREAALLSRQTQERQAAWKLLRERAAQEVSRFKGDAGVVIKDLETGWELSHQKDKLFASASLAKVPLMAACLVAADAGKFKLDRKISLKSSDKLSGSGLLKDLPAGTAFSVWRLIGLMIYESDNTATNILTNLMGLAELNRMFKEFGLKQTTLSRKIADYHARDGRGLENFTTAADMAGLLEKIYRGQLGNAKVSGQCVHAMKLTRLNDRIPRYLPADLTVAHKTGMENGICHDAGIVYTKKGDFVVVVLTRYAGGGSGPSKELIGKLSLHAYQYLNDPSALKPSAAFASETSEPD